MPRLFISHSSQDNPVALAFRHWLVANGWAENDVFIDLHDLRAGVRWREELRKANTACEAVLFLASPDSLDSVECQEELKLADILEKEIIPVIVRDLALDDPRLLRYRNKEIQIVDLRTQPTERISVDYKGQAHELNFSTAALAAIKARLDDLGVSPGSFPWTPKDQAQGPYPGLAAFGEDDAGIFFGREADIAAGLARLRLMRKRRISRLLVIQAASGAGKSSYLKAGLWPRLKRDADFAPLAILRPAQGLLTGPDSIGRRIAPWFQRQRRKKAPGDIAAALMQPDRAEAAAALARLLSEATEIATEARRAGVANARPPAPLLAIDQGEELFAAEDRTESERFLALLAAVFNDLPEDVDPYLLLTIRADSLEPFLQHWPGLGLAAPEMQALPPLSPTAYRDVITKPAEVYTQRARRLAVEPALADKLALDATGGDALPLLAFTLAKLFEQFGADGDLTLARYEGMRGVGGSIDRALADAQRRAGAAGGEENLRRLIVPGLATWDEEANAAKRLVAHESELLAGPRAALKPLADAMVAQRLLTRSAEGEGKGAVTLEAAHEALLRRPPVDGWLAEQKDALKLRDDVLREAKEWESGGQQADFVRRGVRLEAALDLAGQPDYALALAPAKAYLAEGQRLEAASRRRELRAVAAIFVLMAGVIVSLLGVAFKAELEQLAFKWTTESTFIASRVRPYVLTAEAERAKASQPGETFSECDKDCPKMVVLPRGSFRMGAPDGQGHQVKIDYPLAVGEHTVTWDEYDLCVTMRGCGEPFGDAGFGRKTKPVINVSWEEAQKYVAWLSRITGKRYRLLSEAEWEYAARGVTSVDAPHPKYFWGDDDKDICAHANLADQSYSNRYAGNAVKCDDTFENTAPVGKFPANAFGLRDMAGNVWQWVEDPWHADFAGNPPADGSVWRGGELKFRVVRGCSWNDASEDLRAAVRGRYEPVSRNNNLGFRVCRVLVPPRTQ